MDHFATHFMVEQNSVTGNQYNRCGSYALAAYRNTYDAL